MVDNIKLFIRAINFPLTTLLAVNNLLAAGITIAPH
jgi:hypothetical protein